MGVYTNGLTYTEWTLLTAHDSTVQPKMLAFMATGAGDIAITSHAGVSMTLTVTAGQIVQLSPKLIKSTGTTATGIHGLS
jgi:hypothetical protein